MTVSTNAQICYGVLFEENYEFPWDIRKWCYNIQEWWYDVCGYANPFELYDESGRYADGKEPLQERIDQYYASRHAFEKEHPLPIRVVNYCGMDCPAYILAIPEPYIVARRGYPEALSTSMPARCGRKTQALLDFCDEHGLEYESGPTWWLSSYWG